jgi:pyruvate/2-oxoacid:ferredoxin oxidoreductase beta subunit
MLKAALSHRGTVLLDVISPCTTFNDHEGSTKSYKFVKDHEEPLHDVDFVPHFHEIDVDYDEGEPERHHARRLDAAVEEAGARLRSHQQGGGHQAR